MSAPTDYKKEAGRRLREARNNLNLTLEELSARVGKLLSPSRLSNYEQGIRMIGVKEALLRNFRALPEKDRNAYARRIEVLALAYREPVPDERLSPEVRKGVRQRTKSVK